MHTSMQVYTESVYECETERERERERQRDRETERQRDRETERQRDRETERQRDRETERQRERQRDRETESERARERETYGKQVRLASGVCGSWPRVVWIQSGCVTCDSEACGVEATEFCRGHGPTTDAVKDSSHSGSGPLLKERADSAKS